MEICPAEHENVDELASSELASSNTFSAAIAVIGICFFCNKFKIQRKANVLPIHECKSRYEFLAEVKIFAKSSNDVKMINKIESYKGCRIFYHSICYREYNRSSIDCTKASVPKNDWHVIRELNDEASKTVFEFVKKNVIESKKCYSLQLLKDYYLTVYDDFSKKRGFIHNKSFKLCELLQKLQNQFNDEIQVITMHKKKLIAPRDGCIIDEDTFTNASLIEEQLRVGTRVRKCILSIEKKPLPKKLEACHLISGECSKIPEELVSLLLSIITNHDPRRLQSEHTMRIINSIAQDIIYATFDGTMKTSKHITLGLTLKSITSSRKVIDLVSRYGHCCSYHTIEELETEATIYADSKSLIRPVNANLQSNICTGVAFDNYDRFVETINGDGTLHDTFGILYQN